MKHRTLMKWIVSSLLTLTVLSATTSAQSLSYSFDKPLEKTEINQTGELNLFDSNLGTLTGATLKLRAAEDSLLTVHALTSSIVGGGTSSVFNYASTLSTINSLLAPGNPALTLSYVVPQSLYVANEVKVFDPDLILNETSLDLSSVLASLQAPGGGTFNIVGTTNTSTSFSGFGSFDASVATQARIGATIEYTYVTAPEPSIAVLGALSLMGLTFRRRR